MADLCKTDLQRIIKYLDDAAISILILSMLIPPPDYGYLNND